jgi:hypothetical protein
LRIDILLFGPTAGTGWWRCQWYGSDVHDTRRWPGSTIRLSEERLRHQSTRFNAGARCPIRFRVKASKTRYRALGGRRQVRWNEKRESDASRGWRQCFEEDHQSNAYVITSRAFRRFDHLTRNVSILS